ncbi:ester cyclase [Mucilaginibacter sp.]|uniref:ester cyclase n=1 Tax=Mucilaginibacter sp. TaxID=1882438 RepID=UPI0026310DD5|nr:ester cyclase [Mucilaginibacter sp.]MDB4923240.1 lipoprotein [Mucilaginibacter sp.]
MNIKNKLKSVIPGIILFTVVQTARAQDMGSHELPVPKSITLGEKLSDSYSKQLIHTARLFYAFWNTGDPQFARAALADNFKDNTLPKGRSQGVTGVLFASKNFRTIIPDLKCSIEDLLISKDKIVARLVFTGHYTGSFKGQKPTGKPISFFAIDILHIKGGRIYEDWHLEDNLSFLQQIDVVKL